MPRYAPTTPKISGAGPLDIFLPPNPATLAAAALEGTGAVSTVLAKLTQLDEIVAVQTFYREARAKFGDHWRYADILTTLWAAATLSSPKSYLEVGVRTGRSATIVAAAAQTCDIYGFDLWTPEYDGSPNPGLDFVRDELARVGHTGSVTLVSGDSHQTLPDFLRHHPDLYFDLITIDGDKAVVGAASDFAAALPRLKVGGIVVCDDIFVVPRLMRVWVDVIRRDGRYAIWEFTDGGYGVAAAIRMSDGPLRPWIFEQT